MSRPNHIALRLCLAACVIVAVCMIRSPAEAGGPGAFLEGLVRGVGKVGKEIPIGQTEQVLEDLARSKVAREVVETELKRSGQMVEAAGTGGRSAAVARLLGKAAEHLEPGVRAGIEGLDPVSREAALIVARGTQTAERLLPDIVQRERFLREGGAPTVAAIGLHGPESARAALRLSEALEAGTVVAKVGKPAATLADFGRAMSRSGAASWHFWREYVQPHWKLWLGTGALTAYLIDPEGFQDATGKLTEAGFHHLSVFAGRVAAETVRGVGTGSGEGVHQVKQALWETYFNGLKGVEAILGTLAFLFCVGLLLPGIRGRMVRHLAWLWREPGNPAGDSSSKS